MEKITVAGLQSNSDILVGESVDKLPDYLPDTKVFVITDGHILHTYGHLWKGTPCYSVKPGEKSKSLGTAIEIYRWLISQNADRSSFILGIGGGMVCDLAGFVASTYLRGIKFGFVATSLLAQVDASVGGKNGVNVDGYKNIVGTFNQPAFVLCDTSLLKTLPSEELRNGLAEVVKHALIADNEMFDLIEQQTDAILNLDPGMINYLVSRSVKIKSAVVSSDERETGLRRVLNLGHTWGHAVEKTEGIPHGYAVSIGLVFAAGLSVAKRYLLQRDKERLENLLIRLGLPLLTYANIHELFDALLKDKKKEADHVHFVLMQGIGKVVVEPISITDIRDYIGI
jgi:3-dehydroquinate synthase